MLRLASGSAASSYIMRRFKNQDVKNEPFLGFRSGYFRKHDDLIGVGAGVGSNNGKQTPSRACAVLIVNQIQHDHQLSRFQVPFVFEEPCGKICKLVLVGGDAWAVKEREIYCLGGKMIKWQQLGSVSSDGIGRSYWS